MSLNRNQPDYEGAINYALGRLEHELPPDVYYHNIIHTRDGVMEATVLLADACKLTPDEVRLLTVAAAFHDIGFIETWHGHEVVGVGIASQVLPSFGFDVDQIEKVSAMIMATRMPQSPNGLMGQILADADLDVLGRDDFFERSELLRHEMDIYEQPQTSLEWYEGQLLFLGEHKYFTAAARKLRDGGKKANMEAIRSRLEKYKVS